MTQTYATGSAQPLSNGTITFFVTTPIEPVMSLFLQGLVLGLLTTLFVVSVVLVLVKKRKIDAE